MDGVAVRVGVEVAVLLGVGVELGEALLVGVGVVNSGTLLTAAMSDAICMLGCC